MPGLPESPFEFRALHLIRLLIIKASVQFGRMVFFAIEPLLGLMNLLHAPSHRQVRRGSPFAGRSG
jgi:hypothetical protein